IPLLPSGPGGIFDLASRGADEATMGLRSNAHGSGGERGIRTPEARFRRLHTFQACSFNHSDTSPCHSPSGFLPPRGPRILSRHGLPEQGKPQSRLKPEPEAAPAAWQNEAMSYLVLARKWRPRRFAELVGQEHVVRALSNALDTGKVHHAFLFT